MTDLIDIQKKVVPEIFELLESRYYILRTIYYNEPIGRRSLAYELNIGERAVRTEVNILKEQGLLNIESMGMYITDEGKNILGELPHIIYSLKGITELENKLKEVLNIKKVLIVPGNSDDDSLVLKDMGKTTSIYLKKLIKDDYVIGVTGGSTMAHVAEEMPIGKVAKRVIVAPAKGGLGKDVETQSNNIAAKLAKKLDCNYRLLHIPDNIDRTALDAILAIPDIGETLNLIEEMNILVFGIGRADVMAERRQLSQEKIDKLIERGAVAEAFGHYFNIKGNEVWESHSIGLSLKEFKNIENIIGVAGGERKAEAIISISSLRKDMVLITDEGAARRILRLCK